MAVVMRGVVTRLEDGKPHVEVPDLGVGYSFGPLEVATSDPIADRDRVFVAQIGDTPEDIAVVGLINPPPSSSTPAGPAGGDLTGTYPNPTLRLGTVTVDRAVAESGSVGPPWELVMRADDGYWSVGQLPFDALYPHVAANGAATADRLVSATDSRLSNARTPSGAAGGDLAGTYPNPTIGAGKVTSTHILDGTITETDVAVRNKDGAAATPSMRTLGTGALQAAAGSHLHDDRYFTETETDARFLQRIAYTGSLKVVRDLVGVDTGPQTAKLVIQTNQGFTSNMTSLRLWGYNYRGGNETVDLRIGYYPYGASGTFYNLGAVNNGSFAPAMVQLMKRTSDSKIAIVITPPATGWDYPKLLLEGLFASSIPDADLAGWTMTFTDDLSALTAMDTVPLDDRNDAVIRVKYTGTAWPARPSAARYVEWLGPTQPPNMTADDTWVNTSP